MIKMTIFKDIIWKGQDNNVKWKKKQHKTKVSVKKTSEHKYGNIIIDDPP